MKKLIRNLIYKYDILFNFYFLYFFKPTDMLQNYLNEYSKKKKSNLKFIQIGANDGQKNDPIYKFIRRDKWTGLLIEPQKDIFDRLIDNYKDFKNLFFENVAIDHKEGMKDFFKIGFTNARWASGLSSFMREDIQKMIDAGYIDRKCRENGIIPPPNKEEWIKKELIETTTLENLIHKYNLLEIDLLMIDTEGYDFEIIKSIPFHKIKPKVIIYEHSHFQKDLKVECEKYLVEKGYSLIHTQSDSIASLN